LCNDKEVAAVLAQPEVRQRIMTIGAQTVGKSPDHFDAMLRFDYEATEKLVAQIGLKVD
jgi:tripartite-type tricarboxylate transporter receptor subunit TctC